MPLIHSDNQDSTSHSLAVWHASEELSFFEEWIIPYAEERTQLSGLSVKKTKEWFTSRYLVHYLLGSEDRHPCLKDEFGKPFIQEMPMQLSISHSDKFSAAIVGDTMVGIDIQVLVPKIERIAHKFMSASELEDISGKDMRLEYLHAYWGAKESLYKAYGRRGIDFIRELFIDAFDFNPKGTIFSGYVAKENFVKEFKITSKIIQNAMLVYAIEI